MCRRLLAWINSLNKAGIKPSARASEQTDIKSAKNPAGVAQRSQGVLAAAYCIEILGVFSGGSGVDFAGDVAAFTNFQVTIGDLAGYIAGGLNQQ